MSKWTKGSKGDWVVDDGVMNPIVNINSRHHTVWL